MNRASTRTARLLRRDSTPEERRLWQQLRDRKLGGFKFRRQQPFDQYVLDFYCAEKRPNIELDGGQHNGPQKREQDTERDTYLSSHGVKTIRFWNRAVEENLEGVLERIALELGLKK